jgi:hypothetical protein
MSFAFTFQFLSNRKKPAQFLEWVDNTFKAHIEKSHNLIVQFANEFKVTNQEEHEIMQKLKRVMALFPVLKYKSIQLSARPAFYLDFLLCKQDLHKMNTLLNNTIKTIQPYIKSDFLAFFDSEQVLNLTSNEYLISEETVSFIRYQLLDQLSNDHYGLNLNVNDIDSLTLLLKTATTIRELLTSKSANELLRNYLPSLKLEFMMEFLIQADRLSWLRKINSYLYLESLKLSDFLSSQIQKIKDNTSYQRSILRIFSKVYYLSLPGLSSRLFSSVSNSYYSSDWFSLARKFRFSPDFEFNLWTLRAPLSVLNSTGKLIDKASKSVAELFKTSRSYVLGLGVGVYAADPYRQVQFVMANILFQTAYEYFKQPNLEQLLKKYDSVTIVRSFDPNAKPFLTYYESLYNVGPQSSTASAGAIDLAGYSKTKLGDIA